MLLIYLLSLAVMGDLLVTFAWYGWIQNFQILPLLSYSVIFYASWMTLNLAIVWSYTIVCLGLEDLIPSLKKQRAGSLAVQRLRNTISKTKLRRLQSMFWYSIVLLLVGTSIAFDVLFKQYGYHLFESLA